MSSVLAIWYAIIATASADEAEAAVRRGRDGEADQTGDRQRGERDHRNSRAADAGRRAPRNW